MVDTRKLYKKNRIIQGLGINDADYAVSRNELVGGKLKQVWVCPYYSVWKSIFQRCYSPNAHEKYPTYVGCTVDESWKLFSNFREWMVGAEPILDSSGNCPGYFRSGWYCNGCS